MMQKPKAPRESLSPARARRLSYVLSQGWNQQQAAALAFPGHPPDPGYASRLAAWAEEQEVIRTVIDEGQFPAEELRQIRDDIHRSPYSGIERVLFEQSEGTFRSLWVFNSGDNDTEPGRRLARFAANAAWCVRERLRCSETGVVATAFGATVSAIARAVVRDSVGHPIRLHGGQRAIVIPTMGDPLGRFAEQKANTSTAVAALFSQAFADPKPSPSLDGILPVLPRTIPDEQVELFRDHLYRKLVGYADVFGSFHDSPDALIRRADTIVSSAGFFHSPYWEGFGNEAVSPDAIATRAEIMELAEGDIAGVLVRKATLPDEALGRFESLMRHWMGIQMSDFRRIAARGACAPGTGPAGSVLCCIGHKASISKHLICHERVVNHLLCDKELVDELDRLLVRNRR
jgi:hypothetical protein